VPNTTNKKDNTNAVNLSSVASGSGGFVINGKDTPNTSGQSQSGRSVSSAGDVNGDGLDDLVIGAFGSDPFETGKVFVVFGKKDHIRFTFWVVAMINISMSTNNQII
jgi:hypothetical protein